MRNFILLLLAMIFLFGFGGCREDSSVDLNNNNGEFVLELTHMYGLRLFFEDVPYWNQSGDTVYFKTFQYYISDVKLKSVDNTWWHEPDSYHLINGLGVESFLCFIKNIPIGDYKEVSFKVGLDSAMNNRVHVNSTQADETMYNNLRDEYLFIKTTGVSPNITSGIFDYEIGGYNQGYHILQEANHNFGKEILRISPLARPILHIQVDVAGIFDGKHRISVSKTPVVNQPNEQAEEFAENFIATFTFNHIHN